MSHLKRTMRLSVLEGSLGQIFLVWTTGSVLIGYMLHYNASPTQIALVSSIPVLSQMFSPLVAWWASGLSQRRILATALAFIGRSLWVLAALAPNLGIPDGIMPIFLLFVVGLSSLFQATFGTLWTDWMGAVVPEERRGRYFGRRAGIVGVVGMLASLAAGWFLDHITAPISFQLVLGLSVVFALVGASLLLFHFEPLKHKQQLPFQEVLFTPWKSANFRKFLFFAGYFHFGIFLSAALITAYFLQELKMTFTQLAIFSIIASTTALITTNVWGRLADRFGNKPILAASVLIMGIGFPTTWILAGLYQNLNYIWLSAVIDAIAWGAGGPAIFNLALVSAPKNERLSFIAMYSLVTGLMGFLGGAVSGPVLEFLSRFSLGVWIPYYSLFVLSGFMRASSILFLLRVEETREWIDRPLLRQLRPWRRIGFPWR